MFYKDSRQVYRASELDALPWLIHGFGTRQSDIPAWFENLATVKQIHSATVVNAEGRCGILGVGDALLAQGDAAKAAALYAQSLKLSPANAYAAIWLFIAQTRAGAAKPESTLQTNAAKLDAAAWPYPVIDFYLGKKTQQDFLAAPTSDDARCEAQFYAGEERLLRKAAAEAEPFLQKAVASCPKDFGEFIAANAALKKSGQAASVVAAPVVAAPAAAAPAAAAPEAKPDVKGAPEKAAAKPAPAKHAPAKPVAKPAPKKPESQILIGTPVPGEQ